MNFSFQFHIDLTNDQTLLDFDLDLEKKVKPIVN